MKKKTYVLGMAVLVAALLALSGVAQSAMWVGAELGVNAQPGKTGMSVDGRGVSTSEGTGIQPSVIGGATIGYDFVNSGFGAYNWPAWMQYFSFAMDITYNRLHINQGSGVARFFASDVNGWEFAWTFLFMAHYGFLRDSEVPTGRINPYIGVGPAIVWTNIEGTLPTVGGRTIQPECWRYCHERRPGCRTRHPVGVFKECLHRYRHAVPLFPAFLDLKWRWDKG